MQKILIVFLCALIFNGQVFAHENLSHGKEILEEIQKLKEVSDDINAQIKNLEQKIHHLYTQQEGDVKPVAPLSSDNGWHKKSSWSKIKSGMSEQEVISILGTPTRVRENSYDRTLHYEGEVKNYHYVIGFVRFDKNDKVEAFSWPAFE